MIRMLHAEWTKFRTVPAWVFAVVAAVGVIVGTGMSPGMSGTCDDECRLPVGPGGEEVTDRFTFAHLPLTGDGSVTARVASLTGEVLPERQPVLLPWAKAGLIVKAGTGPGATYAAIMLTGGHGTRLQHDFTGDIDGGAASPWLRLSRAGSVVTGSASDDGTTWRTIGTVELDGLPQTVEAGLFATSPQFSEAMTTGFGLRGAAGGPSTATAVFTDVTRSGAWRDGPWTVTRVGGGERPGAGGPPPVIDGDPVRETAGGLAVTGTGDIAPAVSGSSGLGVSVTQTLAGTFLGLLLLVIVGAVSATSEHRRGLHRTTLAAEPRRGRTVVAKALVVGGVGLLAGTLAAAIVVPLGQRVLRGNGVYVNPVATGTDLRMIVGTGALLAVAAVLALAIGAAVRRGAVAVTVVMALTVLPYLLAMTVLPASAGGWLLRLTPAAAFAVQGSATRYPQVDALYTPTEGYFPLPPWVGLGVLCLWAAAALGVALALLRRRDA